MKENDKLHLFSYSKHTVYSLHKPRADQKSSIRGSIKVEYMYLPCLVHTYWSTEFCRFVKAGNH